MTTTVLKWPHYPNIIQSNLHRNKSDCNAKSNSIYSEAISLK